MQPNWIGPLLAAGRPSSGHSPSSVGSGRDCYPFCRIALWWIILLPPARAKAALPGVLFPRATPGKGRRMLGGFRLFSDKCSSTTNTYQHYCPSPDSHPTQCPPADLTPGELLFPGHSQTPEHPSAHRYSYMSVEHTQVTTHTSFITLGHSNKNYTLSNSSSSSTLYSA